MAANQLVTAEGSPGTTYRLLAAKLRIPYPSLLLSGALVKGSTVFSEPSPSFCPYSLTTPALYERPASR
jgi:hypothetical protein